MVFNARYTDFWRNNLSGFFGSSSDLLAGSRHSGSIANSTEPGQVIKIL